MSELVANVVVIFINLFISSAEHVISQRLEVQNFPAGATLGPLSENLFPVHGHLFSNFYFGSFKIQILRMSERLQNVHPCPAPPLRLSITGCH